MKETKVKPRMAMLGAYVAQKPKSLDPRKFPEEEFELFSVPSHADGKPEVVQGKTVGASKQMVEDDTVLLCKINPRINRTWVVSSHTGHRKIASSEWITFPPHPDFLPKYLGYYLCQDELRDHLALNASGVGGSLMRAKPGLVKDYPFPLAPLPEQRRIVSAIETQLGRLDAAVARLHAAKAKLKRYKQAVLKAAVEGALTEEWREKQKKQKDATPLLTQLLSERKKTAVKIKDREAIGPGDDLPELTEGWVWASLEQMGQPNRPIIYGIIKPGPHIPDGVPYVRVTEMKDGTIDVLSLKKASKERAAKFARATLAAGDVLISKDGTIGRVAVVPPELEGGNITQHVMRAPISPLVNRDYVVWAIRSEWCQRWLTGETRGVALRGVNVEDFRRLPIPLPPLAEQERIVQEAEDRMTRAEEMEASLDAQLLQSTRLRQAVLKRAFEGGLVATTGIR